MAWSTLFAILIRQCHEKKSTRVDRKCPLSMKILNFSPEHPVTQTIMYIYSMETFLPQAIKRANAYKDHSKIKSLGPFAMYLAEVIYIAQRARKTGRNAIVSL